MRKTKTKKRRKFRILLDAAFAKPSVFENLCKKANVKHPVLDYGLSPQAEDKDIYNLAVKEELFVVTINYKDFKKLVSSNKPGVIAIHAELSNEKIDAILSQFVTDNDPNELWGRTVKIPVA